MISPAYAATAEAAHGPFYSEPEFWLLVAFVIFVGLMAKPVWRKVTAGLDARAAEIAAELDEARQLREEAQATLASYQRKQRDAAKEAEDIIAHAQEEAARLTQAAEKTLADIIKRHEALTVDKIALAQARAVEEVKAEAVEIALAATRRLLEERLDEARSDALIEDALRELPAKLQ
jgi:F-type H+-transporting ATPase subunit b